MEPRECPSMVKNYDDSFSCVFKRRTAGYLQPSTVSNQRLPLTELSLNTTFEIHNGIPSPARGAGGTVVGFRLRVWAALGIRWSLVGRNGNQAGRDILRGRISNVPHL